MAIASPLTYFRGRKIRLLLLVADMVVIAGSYYAAFYLRFEGNIPAEMHDVFVRTAPLIVSTGLLYLLVFEVYRGMWRYASINDLYQIIKAITATAVSFVIILYLIRHQTVPRSVVIIQWLVSLVGIGGLRFAARLFRKALLFSQRQSPVLIVGAGDAGEMVVRQMLNNPHYGYDAVGFIDDDPRKRNMRLHGVKVLGGRDRIPSLVQRKAIQEVIIATPRATGTEMRLIVDACKAANVKYRTLPGPRELVGGDVSLAQLREVKLDDLLGREPIITEASEVSKVLSDRRVLVTGAGGSIGSELCRQILEYRPSQLVCLERAENSLFFLEQELRRSPIGRDNPELILPIICDIGNRRKLSRLFDTFRPNAVFHAAAHKHVPLMEAHPEEAVLNNVIGTLNALEYCDEFEVDEFVLISTDKAVTPTSVMGASKRVAEFLTQSFAGQTETRCITVRFGNVIGSNGSVVPLFQKQIALGGPVTVTDPNMRRYFMTIPEAVQLITQAASMGNGGDVLILDMGEPVRVMDMAEQLITLSGFRPGEDIEIEIIGLRPGEKLEEALWHEWEKPSQPRHSKILAAHSEPRDWQQIMADVERLRVAATEMDPNRVVALLQEVIPDYTPMGRIGTRQAATAPDPSAQRSATNPSI